MDLQYFDDVKPTGIEQQLQEQTALKELANKVGLYLYNYTAESGEDTTLEHLGPVAQQLETVEGLSSLVKEKDGIKQVDTNMAALACLSYCAALARIVLGEKLLGVKLNDNSTEMD